MNLMNICTQHLVAIGEALQAYEKDHDDYPKWLSDLHPHYLRDASILVCPADEEKGIPILPYDEDPNLPVSYEYEIRPEYRVWIDEERRVYGDTNPIVRCPHHADPEADSTLMAHLYLNLSFSYQIYKSTGRWTNHPIEAYGNLEAAIRAFEKGIQHVPDNQGYFGLYPGLVRLYVEAGREQDADNLINSFKSVMQPERFERFRDYFFLSEMFEEMGRHEERFQLFEELERQDPRPPGVIGELAKIHEKLGNAELAEAYRIRSNPRLKLIGKPIADFSATDLEGNPISLQHYREKVVLLDFWAVWCGPCIGEMPNMKKVYDAYKDKGFDVIGVSFDNDEAELREYLKVCNIPWRQIFDGQGGPLKKQYGIGGIPSPWLIDREGKLISYSARGTTLWQLVAEAVKKV